MRHIGLSSQRAKTITFFPILILVNPMGLSQVSKIDVEIVNERNLAGRILKVDYLNGLPA
jgi:hypothetical protein